MCVEWLLRVPQRTFLSIIPCYIRDLSLPASCAKQKEARHNLVCSLRLLGLFSCKIRHLSHGMLHTWIMLKLLILHLPLTSQFPDFWPVKIIDITGFLASALILWLLACQLAAKNSESTLFSCLFDLGSSGPLANSSFTAISETFIPSFMISDSSRSPLPD